MNIIKCMSHAKQKDSINPFPFLNGILAGGAVRDYILRVKPHDYDYFYVNGKDNGKFISDQDLLAKMGAKRELQKKEKEYGAFIPPATFLYNNNKIQLILLGRKLNAAIGHDTKTSLTVDDSVSYIFSKFDLTFCMFAAANDCCYTARINKHGKDSRPGNSIFSMPFDPLGDISNLARREIEAGYSEPSLSPIVAIDKRVIASPKNNPAYRKSNERSMIYWLKVLKRAFMFQERYRFKIDVGLFDEHPVGSIQQTKITSANINSWVYKEAASNVPLPF